MENLQDRIRQLHGRMNAEDAATARENFLKQLERAPEDYLLRENFALFLQANRNLPQSIAEWRRVRDLIPQDCLAYLQMGRMLGGQDQWSEAELSLREAVKIRPSLTEGWIELGNVLASQGKFEPALASYTVAWRQRPQDPQTAFRLGGVLAKLKEARLATEATFYRRQLSFGLMDLALHTKIHDTNAGETLPLSNQTLAEVFLPRPADTAFVAYFGHIIGYGAGYYGYAWADAIAADMATVFEKSPEGYFDKTAGMRLRREIYEVGDSRDVNVSIEQFLGRPSSIEPFLKKIGVKTDAAVKPSE